MATTASGRQRQHEVHKVHFSVLSAAPIGHLGLLACSCFTLYVPTVDKLFTLLHVISCTPCREGSAHPKIVGACENTIRPRASAAMGEHQSVA